MSNSSNAINDTVEAFIKALALSGHSIDHSQFEINDLKAPHEPKSLPRGRMAVYLFMHGDVAYKIGKVGPKSNTRFQTQHYSAASSNSNLAKSLLDDESGPCSTLSATPHRYFVGRKDGYFDLEFLGSISSLPICPQI